MPVQSALLLLFLLFVPTSWGQGNFQRSDLIGEASLCADIQQNLEAEASCSPFHEQTLKSSEESIASLDKHLALEEIRRNVLVMAESQVQNSLTLLKTLGMPKPGMDLERKLLSLKVIGINPKLDEVTHSPGLLKKYSVAALRYHEYKSLIAQKKFTPNETKSIHEKIKLLELRFPLISHHHFGNYASSYCRTVKMDCRPTKENPEADKVLDAYLFEDKDINAQKIELNSLAGKALIQEFNLSEILKELELSFSNQLNPLLSLKSLEQCDLMNLHSKVTLQVINSSANPEKLFGQYCKCQLNTTIVNEDLVLGLEVTSLGGLGLCLTPTGVGQVLGCPTAAVAGLGAGAANTINFLDQAQNFQTISDQKRIVQFLDRMDLQKEEEKYLKEKELQSMKEAGVSGLIGLIGFGVGNVGFKKLVQYFDRGKVSKTMSSLNAGEKTILENSLSEVSPEKQTKAFVLLEKLDEESREVILKRPEILIQAINKKSKDACEL